MRWSKGHNCHLVRDASQVEVVDERNWELCQWYREHPDLGNDLFQYHISTNFKYPIMFLSNNLLFHLFSSLVFIILYYYFNVDMVFLDGCVTLDMMDLLEVVFFSSEVYLLN